MTDVIEEIIREKPHLTDPFRFYQKTLKFRESIRELHITPGPGQAAYAPEVIDDIFQRFSSFLELPEGTLSPLKQAMELREIDFTRLPMGEIPAFSLPYAEDDLAVLMFLLSKPYFIALRNSRPMDDRSWEEGKCPVCKGQTSISWISEDGRRQVSCSFCSTMGYVDRVNCPICLGDQTHQNVLVFEREEGFTINTCKQCNSYVKTVDTRVRSRFSYEVADLMTLPLDIIVQEKGFVRRAPNPVGMRKITMRG